MTYTLSMTANAEKDFIEKMEQQQEEQHKKIQQHFEERWQETINNRILLDGNPSEEVVSFVKSVFLYGCNVGWNECYTFHEHLIQKGFNQQLDK